MGAYLLWEEILCCDETHPVLCIMCIIGESSFVMAGANHVSWKDTHPLSGEETHPVSWEKTYSVS